MIEVKQLCKKFGEQLSLDNVNLSFKQNESAIIMGQNGAGKTTLIRTILGEYIPSQGTVSINGYDPFKNRQEALQNIGFVPQLPPPIKLSVSELIHYAVVSSGSNKETIFDLCQKLELDVNANLNKLFYKLSGGMKQKLLIAIALAKNPKIFIFDEPTANLDPKGRDIFYSILNDFLEERIMIFISHRIEEVHHIVNRKIEMDLGKVILDEKI
ncbi:MAG: ABC transporter ATP-binding protein [Arcobacteraceae bacterium]